MRRKHWAIVGCGAFAFISDITLAQPDIAIAPKRANPPPLFPGPQNRVEAKLNVHLLKPDGTVAAYQTIFYGISSRQGTSSGSGRRTDKEGRVELTHFRAGTARLFVSVRDVGTAFLDEVTFDENRPQTVDVQLQAGSDLHITARELTVDGKPGRGVGAASIEVDLLNVKLLPGDGIQLGGEHSTTARFPTSTHTREGDGIAIIKNMLPGRYRILIDSPFYDVVRREVEIKAGQSTSLDVELQREVMTTLQITVRGEDDNPVADTEMRFSLQPTETSSRYFRNTERTLTTDKNGEAFIYPIRPGSYHIYSQGEYSFVQNSVQVLPTEAHLFLTVKKRTPVLAPPVLAP